MHFGIISAGEGSRLASEGFGQPKPLVPICGVPMIERLARIFSKSGAERIAVIVNEKNAETVSLLEQLSIEIPLDLVVKSTPTPMHSLQELSPYLGDDRFDYLREGLRRNGASPFDSWVILGRRRFKSVQVILCKGCFF